MVGSQLSGHWGRPLGRIISTGTPVGAVGGPGMQERLEDGRDRVERVGPGRVGDRADGTEPPLSGVCDHGPLLR